MNTSDDFPTWDQISSAAAGLSAPMRAYLTQVATTLRCGSVRNSDQALRCFTQFLLQEHPGITQLADVRRAHIEDYKPWLTTRTGRRGRPISVNTRAHRLGNLRTFFIRIHDWD